MIKKIKKKYNKRRKKTTQKTDLRSSNELHSNMSQIVTILYISEDNYFLAIIWQCTLPL